MSFTSVAWLQPNHHRQRTNTQILTSWMLSTAPTNSVKALNEITNKKSQICHNDVSSKLKINELR